MINRNQLALFHAVAEEGGFGRAARLLRISQPAVSIQISQLEDALGIRLFDRIGRTIRLTDAGQTLASYARRITALEREADQAMRQFTATESGRLRIGASTTIGAYLLPQLMSDFRKQWPHVTLEMTLGNTTIIQQQLVDGVIDLGLVEGKKLDLSLTLQAFRDDQLVPIAAWDHPLTRVRKPNLRKFLKYPLILREPGSGTRQTVLEFLAGKGHPAAKILAGAGQSTPQAHGTNQSQQQTRSTARSNKQASSTIGQETAGTIEGFSQYQSFGSNEAVKGAVAAGLGVSFVSSLTIPGDVMLKRLEVLNLTDAKVIRRPFYVIQIPGRTHLPAVTAFLSILRKR